MTVLGNEVSKMRVDRQKVIDNNNRLQALLAQQSASPRAGTVSLRSRAIAGNSPQPSEELKEEEAQRRSMS